jgi:hypothetical protein
MMSKFFPLVLASAILTACGGGGGSSSSSNGSNTSSNNTNTSTAATAYTGKRDTAQLTAANQGDFVRLLLEAIVPDQSIVNVTAASLPFGARGGNAGALASPVEAVQQLQQQVVGMAKQQLGQSLYQAKTYSGTKACPGGGSATVSGTLDDTSYIGTLTFTFSQCDLGGGNGVVSGSASLLVSATDVPAQEPTDFTLAFNATSVTIGGSVYSETGTKRVIKDLANASEQVITNWYSLNQTTGVQSWEDNVRTNFTTNGDTVSGNLCDGASGCVSLATTVPYREVAAVPVAGDILMTGVNSKLRVYINASGMPYVDLDANGDGTYETSTPLSSFY